MNVAVPEYGTVAAFLQSRSAERLPHLQGSLREHLDGTYQLLNEWGNPPHVCNAGLCHAVYGTDGFAARLLDVDTERDQLARVIGHQAESLVYLYASCDRQFVYPQLGSASIIFRDRFNGREFPPDPQSFGWFMELTFANELDIFRKDASLVAAHRESFGSLFNRSRELVSQPAFACYLAVFGAPHATVA